MRKWTRNCSGESFVEIQARDSDIPPPNSTDMKKCFFTLMLTITASLQLPAAVIHYDFESLSGNIDGVDGWSVDRTNTTATVLTTGGLSYTGGDISINGGNRHLSLSMPAGDVANALQKSFTLSGQGDGSTVYFSFLYQASAASSSEFAISGLANGPDMRDSGAVLADRTTPQARLYDASQNSGTATAIAGGLGNDTTYFLVGRVTFNSSGDEEFDLILDPTSTDEATAFASPNTVSRDIGVTAFDQFGVLASGANAGTKLYDEIRIGNSYAEVIAVPEPQTALLAVIGATLVLLASNRRRRQKQISRTRQPVSFGLQVIEHQIHRDLDGIATVHRLG